jgi:hypothetical protein
MTREEFEALTRVYQPGERVRARMKIIYGQGGEVEEGALGFVQQRRDSGVLSIAWQGMPDLVRWTSPDAVELAP